jgi:hypothetical protein
LFKAQARPTRRNEQHPEWLQENFGGWAAAGGILATAPPADLVLYTLSRPTWFNEARSANVPKGVEMDGKWISYLRVSTDRQATRFHFKTVHGAESHDDPEGMELKDLRAAWKEATWATGEILKQIDGSSNRNANGAWMGRTTPFLACTIPANSISAEQ